MKEIVALVIIGLLVLSLVYPLALAQGPDEDGDGDEEPPVGDTTPPPGSTGNVGENENFSENTTGGQGGQPFPFTTLVLVVVILVIIGAIVALLARRREPELPLIPP